MTFNIKAEELYFVDNNSKIFMIGASQIRIRDGVKKGSYGNVNGATPLPFTRLRNGIDLIASRNMTFKVEFDGESYDILSIVPE